MSTELLRRAAKEMRKDSEALIDILPRQLDYNLAIAEWLTYRDDWPPTCTWCANEDEGYLGWQGEPNDPRLRR